MTNSLHCVLSLLPNLFQHLCFFWVSAMLIFRMLEDDARCPSLSSVSLVFVHTRPRRVEQLKIEEKSQRPARRLCRPACEITRSDAQPWMDSLLHLSQWRPVPLTPPKRHLSPS